jgi:SecD/SecF fusion protein
MKNIILLSFYTLAISSCKHANFAKDGGSRITLEASVGELLKPYIQMDDSLAYAAINETYKEYLNQDKPFIDLYFDKLDIADSTFVMGKHFKGIGLAVKASASECKVYFGGKLSEAMDNISLILLKRINEFGIENPIVRKGEKAERLIIELPGKNIEITRVKKLLQSSAKLEFWETYDNKDIFQKLNDINAALSKELYPDYKKDTVIDDQESSVKSDKPGTLDEQLAATDKKKELDMESVKKENPLFAVLSPAYQYNASHQFEGITQGSAVGTAHVKDTALVNKYLNMPSAKKMLGRYTKFLWAFKAQDEKGQYFQLLGIKVRRNGLSPLSGNIIKDARVIFDNPSGGMPQISMTMTQQAGWDWANLTRDNIGNNIAIVIDDQVYSYPVVLAEIPGGVSSITGNFSVSEAKDFANILKAGYLPLPLRVVEEEVVAPVSAK